MFAGIVGLAGVALIFSGELQMGAPVSALFAVFAATAFAALSGVALKMVPPQSPFPTNGVAAVVGAGVCFVGSLVFRESHAIPRTFAAWGPILYLVIAGNLGAFILYTWLLRYWPVTSVATVSLIVPVIAITLGAIVKGESPGAVSCARAVLVLIGVAGSLRTGRSRAASV
jgi:drug/metabolite transporter (DMT)-like permease